MKPLHVIMSVVAGAVAGATVGLLLAPSKGSDTREAIIKCLSKRCKKNRKELEELASEIEEELDDKL